MTTQGRKSRKAKSVRVPRGFEDDVSPIDYRRAYELAYMDLLRAYAAREYDLLTAVSLLSIADKKSHHVIMRTAMRIASDPLFKQAAGSDSWLNLLRDETLSWSHSPMELHQAMTVITGFFEKVPSPFRSGEQSIFDPLLLKYLAPPVSKPQERSRQRETARVVKRQKKESQSFSPGDLKRKDQKRKEVLKRRVADAQRIILKRPFPS